MKQLHRFANDRKIAGICAGLAEYFEIDPVIFRVVFLVSLFFGGLGLLVYLIMWILVPLQDGAAQPGTARRLRLSQTDRKIAGVCGGLGEFFELDPIFFRVGFIVLALACGFGILLYLVLWLLMPRASAVAA